MQRSSHIDLPWSPIINGSLFCCSLSYISLQKSPFRWRSSASRHVSQHANMFLDTDLNHLIAEATVFDLRHIYRRYLCIDRIFCSVWHGIILHEMTILFFIINHLIKEGGQNQSHITFRIYYFVKKLKPSYPPCELHCLPIHTEEPKDVMTSLGLLLIEQQCLQVFLWSVCVSSKFIVI